MIDDCLTDCTVTILVAFISADNHEIIVDGFRLGRRSKVYGGVVDTIQLGGAIGCPVKLTLGHSWHLLNEINTEVFAQKR